MDELADNEFGEYIKSARKERNMTLVEMSQAADISFSQLSKIERGQSVPTKAKVESIAEALGLDTQALLLMAGYADDDIKRVAYETTNIVSTQHPLYKGGMVAGAALGSVLMPGIGTVLGGLVGGLIGNKLKSKITSEEPEMLTRITAEEQEYLDSEIKAAYERALAHIIAERERKQSEGDAQ